MFGITGFAIGGFAGPWADGAGWRALSVAGISLLLILISGRRKALRLDGKRALFLTIGVLLGAIRTAAPLPAIWPEIAPRVIKVHAVVQEHRLVEDPRRGVPIRRELTLKRCRFPHTDLPAPPRLLCSAPPDTSALAPFCEIEIDGLLEVFRGRPRLSVKSPEALRIREGWRSRAAMAMERLRFRIRRRLESGLDARSAALTRSLLLGDRFDRESERQDLRDAGAAHFLAVSGLHLGLLIGILSRLPWSPRWRFVAAISAAVFYTLLSGARPPVLRAAGIVLLFLCARNLRRPMSSAWTLIVMAAIAFLVSPGLAEDLRFQLSFAALAGILWIGLPMNPKPGFDDLDRLEKELRRRAFFTRWFDRLKEAGRVHLGLSSGAILATSPLTLHHFETLAPAGLISSWCLLPCVAGLLVLAPMSLILPLSIPLELTTACFFGLAAWIARLPGGSFEVAPPSPLAIGLLISSLGLAALRLGFPETSAKKTAGRQGCLALLPVLGCLLIIALSRPDTPLTVTSADGDYGGHLVIDDGRHGLFVVWGHTSWTPVAEKTWRRARRRVSQWRHLRLSDPTAGASFFEPMPCPATKFSAGSETSDTVLWGRFRISAADIAPSGSAVDLAHGGRRILVAPGLSAAAFRSAPSDPRQCWDLVIADGRRGLLATRDWLRRHDVRAVLAAPRASATARSRWRPWVPTLRSRRWSCPSGSRDP